MLIELNNFHHIEIKGKDKVIIGDPNGIVEYCLYSKPLPVVSEEYKCFVTDRPGLAVQTDTLTLDLVPDIVRRLFLVALTPEEYKRIRKAVYDHEFWIHDDFYDENGIALQPKKALT